jgi:FtsH-binding integral membrane protein
VGGSRGSSSRFFAWVHSRRGALTLERLGLPACLAIAYLHPTMLWINELPIHVRLFGVILSVAGAAMWFALGLAIYRLQPIAPAIALFVYITARFGHVIYAKLGHGVEEDMVTLAVTGALALVLCVSVYGTVERRRRAQTTYLGKVTPY